LPKPNLYEVRDRKGDYRAELAAWYAQQPAVWREFYDEEGRPRCRKCGAGNAEWTHVGFRCAACAPQMSALKPLSAKEARSARIESDVAEAHARRSKKGGKR
jgi:hypothetical protein